MRTRQCIGPNLWGRLVMRCSTPICEPVYWRDCSWRLICVARSNAENFVISINRLLLSFPERLRALRLCRDGSIQLAACSDQMHLSRLRKKPASYASSAGGIYGKPAGKSASGEQVHLPIVI